MPSDNDILTAYSCEACGEEFIIRNPPEDKELWTCPWCCVTGVWLKGIDDQDVLVAPMTTDEACHCCGIKGDRMTMIKLYGHPSSPYICESCDTEHQRRGK